VTDTAALLARITAVEARLAVLGERDLRGLTGADAATGERWEPGQVWAHLAESPRYWVGQIWDLLAARAAGRAEPIPFGRTRADPARAGAIEARRHESPADLLGDVRAGIEAARTLCATLTPAEWSIEGLHPALGTMTLSAIVARFVAAHLEEHATQLEELAVGADAV
jgi:hypothetical protein